MKKVIALTLALLMSLSCFSVISFAEGTEVMEHLTEVPEGYIGLYTKDDLDNIKVDMAGKYILMNDVIFNDADYVKGGDFYNSGKGWDPIGTTDTPFTGIFDGNGYSIKNLYINNPQQNYIGLFGYLKSASVKNISIENATIVGKDYVGGIIGYIYSDVYSGCEVTCCNFGGSVEGSSYVGGIVGITNNSLTVSYCNTKGSVKGNDYVGGIAGQQKTSPGTGQTRKNYIKYCNNSASVTSTNYSGGIVGTSYAYYYSYYVSGSYSSTYYIGETYIENCMNSGDVVAENASAGGIVAYSSNSNPTTGTTSSDRYITNCGNCGSVTATSNAGGLVAKSYDSKTNVKHSYSVGTVTATSDFGGCFGESDVKTTFCYYLDEAVNEPTCKTGIAKSEDQLRKRTTFEQWDFDTVWTMDGREDYRYPELRDVDLVLPEDTLHKHEYTSEITTPATHLAEGVETFTCECGDTYTESIAKLDEHKHVGVITTPATHLAEGVKTFTCECGDTYTESIAKLDEHKHVGVITTPATHLAEGVETFTCECGDTYTESIAKLAEHKHVGVITTPATHLEEGVKTFTCECGDTYTESVAKLEGHTYNETVTKPTCTTQGYTTYTCACGHSYKGEYTGVLGHKYTSNVLRPATHLSVGKRVYTCTVCGDSYDEDIPRIKEHTYGVTNIVEPTCEKDGYLVYTCECGDSYNEEYISKTGHDYSGNTCQNCGKTKTDNCSCNCHKTGFMKFIWKIINFFNKLFKNNKTCACGVAHY